ncbi:MAG: phenylalanine--tRNA ligase subunit beta [Candidatus Abyssobacteria bacterium SURF_5]|uniref:Phenylalanine--tRNA ligase beta subunit n=1 Tax=Abyssobacteria bacterium (strain SURF_5) TaxID=2093360 RepID=A0A3A4MV79_ABYX5|nr:MAG: phenylalanine--tRNA ligase subunit beta [Candidatus Abyssubacteria bacterium SURF_5]
MRVSLNWLKEFVAVRLSPADLAHKLTMTGTEVDSVQIIKSAFEKVTVGRILKIRRHPNADKLVLCEVDVGNSSPLKIVCGAPNIKEGDIVPVAVSGAKLAGGFSVHKTKIRGESSEGMLCSERELGISEDHSGIMILPPDLPTGVPLDEALQLSDALLELGVTPNRPDCLSIFGTAREVAAITGEKTRLPDIRMREAGAQIESLTSVTIEDEKGCPRYAARVVSGVTIGASPAWMQQRLLKAGLRPINNVVDITNYVLLELGHPLHAFDYHKLFENRIVVRRALPKESIVTLDGANRGLTEQMLVIADAEKPVAIAGVMGGANSEVTEQTKTVLIESAYFDPVTIRRTSKALGLSTEASFRFERGADPQMLTVALDRAAALMAEVAGGTVAAGSVDQYPHPFSPKEISVRHERIRRILGIRVPPDKAISILDALGFEIVSTTGESVRVRVPSYRPDVGEEIDLIEEVARVYGYENIIATYPEDRALMTRGLPAKSAEEEVKALLKGCGFTEIITFSFGDPEEMKDFSGDGYPAAPIRMRNPLAEDESVLRTTLMPGLLGTIRSNINIGRKNLKLFEVGKIFWPAPGETLPDEHVSACGAATGLRNSLHWKEQPAEVDFFDLKGVVETLLDSLGFDARAVKSARPGFHPGKCADIEVAGKTVGRVGEIHPDIIQKYELKQKTFLFELDLSTLLSCPKTEKEYLSVSRFPYSDRDMAVVVDENIEAAKLVSAITEAGEEILRRVLLFDVYRGAQVESGKKSLAFSLRFQSVQRTLTDEEITAAFNKIVQSVQTRFGAQLRK